MYPPAVICGLCDPTQYNKRYILSTFDKVEIFAIFAIIPNSWKLKWCLGCTTFTMCVFPLFSLYFTLYFVHYLRIKLAAFCIFCFNGSHISITIFQPFILPYFLHVLDYYKSHSFLNSMDGFSQICVTKIPQMSSIRFIKHNIATTTD